MKRYVIERDLPGVGTMNRAQFKDVATTTNNALAKLAGNVEPSNGPAIHFAGADHGVTLPTIPG